MPKIDSVEPQECTDSPLHVAPHSASKLAEMFVRLASDIALVVSSNGFIESVVQSDARPIDTTHDWVGRAWIDTVTGETRPKIEKMLREATTSGVARRREINHLVSAGDSVPMSYTALLLGEGGPVLAVGRDLRAVAAIQQRFLEAQKNVEQSYWKAREVASRYELVFKVATDAMILVDGETLRIVEANRAATQLFALSSEEIVGRAAVAGFDRRAHVVLEELMHSAKNSGQHYEVRARLNGKLIHTLVAVTPFRVAGAVRLLMRVCVDENTRRLGLPTTIETVSDRLTAHPAGSATASVVVTDSCGTIVTASVGFLNLVLTSDDEVRGQLLSGWLEPGVLPTLVERVRQEGLVTELVSLRGGGQTVPVEVSAALLADDDQERIGFTFFPTGPATTDPVEAAILDVSGLLGTSPLSVLLERAGALLERKLIAKALEQAGGDETAAAALLSISTAELARRRRGVD